MVSRLTAVPLGAAFFWLVVSCAWVPDPRPGARITVASWNVQNLFDEVTDGGEYPEFDPAQGWTRARFWGRCASLAPVIRALAGGPDILVLQEVEGRRAADVLADRFLPDLGYRHRFLAPPEVPGVKTVFLSRYPLVRTGLLHPSAEGLRPIVEAEFNLGGRSLVVLANHWKSRIPSPRATEGLRRASAEVLARRMAVLDVRPDGPLVLAVGDFNTSLELSRPWDDRALASAGAAGEDPGCLVVYPGRKAASASSRPGAVWDPWETVTNPPGSYLYRGVWNRLDHIFITVRSLRRPGWEFAAFEVAVTGAEPPAWSFQHPDGISDHFPVAATFLRTGP